MVIRECIAIPAGTSEVLRRKWRHDDGSDFDLPLFAARLTRKLRNHLFGIVRRRHHMSQQQGEEMRVDPSRAKVLVENLEQVAKRVDAVRGSRKVGQATGRRLYVAQS